jgi:diaminopimelate decarboxylase
MSRAQFTRRRHAQVSRETAAHSLFFAFHRPAEKGGAASTELYCENVPLRHIADVFRTPAYIYSQASMESAYRQLDRSLSALPHSICYAVKANSNLSVLRVFAHLGSCFDIVSGGELDRLGKIGVPGDRIVFSGAGKSSEEIREALCYRQRASRNAGILLFNVESEPELDILLSESGKMLAKGIAPASAAIRVNPDVSAGGHPHISTGQRQHKFGMSWPDASRLYLAHKNSRVISWRGIGAHIGSQIFSVQPYRRSVAQLAAYFRELACQGVALRFLDIGGGFGVRYTEGRPLDTRQLARMMVPVVRPLGCRLLVEPGRSLVGPSGVLLMRVLYVKEASGKKFVIVDAAMNDLIRPVLYGAAHPVMPVMRKRHSRVKPEIVDVVGPVCETGDFLARRISLPSVKAGDLLAIGVAGAYGFAQSSNYNSRPRAAEILVQGDRFRIVRRRESREDLTRGES